MLGRGLISPIIESEWVTLIVISIKRNGGRNKGIDFRMLNDVCEIPFPHHYRKKYGGGPDREVYPFTDGFFGYHQVEIAEGGNKLETTFIADWGLALLIMQCVMPV